MSECCDKVFPAEGLGLGLGWNANGVCVCHMLLPEFLG